MFAHSGDRTRTSQLAAILSEKIGDFHGIFTAVISFLITIFVLFSCCNAHALLCEVLTQLEDVAIQSSACSVLSATNFTESLLDRATTNIALVDTPAGGEETQAILM